MRSSARRSREQPALLLRLLVQALLQSGRLSNDRALTHRELAAYAAASTIPGSATGSSASRCWRSGCCMGQPPPRRRPRSRDRGWCPQSQLDQALADGRGLYAQWIGRGRRAP
jgi:hypothetical protein